MAVNASAVKTFLDLSTHPVTVVSGIKEGLEGGAINAAQAAAAAISTVATFANAVSESSAVKALGKEAVGLSLSADGAAAYQELHKYGYVSDATMMGLAADGGIPGTVYATSNEEGSRQAKFFQNIMQNTPRCQENVSSGLYSHVKG